MKTLILFIAFIVAVTGEGLEGEDGSTLFVQSVRPRTVQSVVEEEVQRVKRVKSEVYPPLDKSYWIPYSDRTVSALSFPILTHEIFTPVVLKAGEALIEPTLKKLKVQKPKSDVGVIISRNTVLRENFRDYANLSQFPTDMKPSDSLLVDAAKAFASIQRAGRSLHTLKTEKLLGVSSVSNFVMVALETRVKYPRSSDAKHFGTFGNAEILRNGTISFPSAKLSSLLVHIPFIFKSPADIEHVFDNYDSQSGHLVPQEKTEIKAFLKLVYGLHEDQFGDGDEAVQRILRRTRSLKRPRFVFPVEDASTNSSVEEVLRNETAGRQIMWLYTNSVAMRVLSSPIYLQHLVPVAPVVHKEPVVSIVPEPVVKAVQADLVHKEHSLPVPLIQKEAPLIQKEHPLPVPLIQKEVPLENQLHLKEPLPQFRVPVVPQNLHPHPEALLPQPGPYAPFFSAVPQPQQTFFHPQHPQSPYFFPSQQTLHQQIKK